jgi:hypothetical protein
MSGDEYDLVEKLHREAAERHWEEERRGRELVLKLHDEAVREFSEQQRRMDEVIARLHCDAVQPGPEHPVPSTKQPTVHYTELPEAKPDSPLYREWNTYRRDAGRLLTEGHGGRHVLIKGEEIVGIWATHDEAMIVGYQRFLDQPFLVHQIEERERVPRCVTVHGCHSLRLRYRPAS